MDVLQNTVIPVMHCSVSSPGLLHVSLLQGYCAVVEHVA